MLAKKISPEIAKILRHEHRVADGLFCHHWEKSRIKTNTHNKKKKRKWRKESFYSLQYMKPIYGPLDFIVMKRKKCTSFFHTNVSFSLFLSLATERMQANTSKLTFIKIYKIGFKILFELGF